MADEPVAEHLDEQPEEEGGPVKSFLEHLEDLRWVLIKSGVAAGVAMLGCLLAGNYVIRVLEWPLSQAPMRHGAKMQTVRVLFGTNQLSVLHLTTNDPLASLVGTNRLFRLELTPVVRGTNQVLEWSAQDDSEAPLEQGLARPDRQPEPGGLVRRGDQGGFLWRAGAVGAVHLLLCGALRVSRRLSCGRRNTSTAGWRLAAGCSSRGFASAISS